MEIVKKSSGLKTGLVVYGVGDHGGGPTRRDVERALEMQTWKIYPKIRFGTFRDYFHEAEKIREKLPVVNEELNYFANGCYTTQSRIKRGNRRLEAAFYDAEAMSALAGQKVGFPYAKEKLTKAWEDVLFTHFHDILTGSCVQDSREHAMGLFQTSMATANTQITNAMRVIAEKIDTSSIPVDIDAYNSQSEGAGVGYGIENFVGVPSTERGSGRTRIFHLFNSLSHARREVAELTVWDWTGDLRRLAMRDADGNDIPFQLVDHELQQYWDHKYIRVLVDQEVPALGYTTVVLYEKGLDSYPVYLQTNEQVTRCYDDVVLENEQTIVTISAETGRIKFLVDKTTGQELIGRRKRSRTCVSGNGMQDLQRMEHRQSDQKRAGGSLRRAEQSCDRRTQKQCNRTLYRRKFYRGSDLCSGKRPAAGSRRAEGRLERNRQRHHSGSDLADASVLSDRCLPL